MKIIKAFTNILYVICVANGGDDGPRYRAVPALGANTSGYDQLN